MEVAKRYFVLIVHNQFASFSRKRMLLCKVLIFKSVLWYMQNHSREVKHASYQRSLTRMQDIRMELQVETFCQQLRVSLVWVPVENLFASFDMILKKKTCPTPSSCYGDLLVVHRLPSPIRSVAQMDKDLYNVHKHTYDLFGVHGGRTY